MGRIVGKKIPVEKFGVEERPEFHRELARKHPAEWNSAGIFSCWFIVGIQVAAVVVEAKIVTMRVTPVTTEGILSIKASFQPSVQPNLRKYSFFFL